MSALWRLSVLFLYNEVDTSERRRFCASHWRDI